MIEKYTKKHGKRYCKTCGNALQKRGLDARKKQRWLCKNCNKSCRLSDDRQSKVSLLKDWLNWILTKKTIKETVNYSRSTFWRKTRQFWHMKPNIEVTGEIYNHILADAKYINKKALLVMQSEHGVVGFVWANSETKDEYKSLFSRLPAPSYLMCDGHRSIWSASQKVWQTTKIQRCIVHLKRYVRNLTGQEPKTECGQVILHLCNRLFQIKTKRQSQL